MALTATEESELLELLEAEARYGNRDWRLRNLYFIQNEAGERVRFEPNEAQRELLAEDHPLLIVLKARQLGFTTVIQILMLDACLFTPNTAAGVIAHTREDAEAFFTNKIRYAYENIPEEHLPYVPGATQDSVRALRFDNGSSIRVGTSLRSGTFQWLHISEFGKVCAKYPEKAREIKTGALNTVHAGQRVYVESTAEGREGAFYEMTQTAKGKVLSGAHLTPMDFKFLFVPWFKDSRYTLSGDVSIPAELKEYLDGLPVDLTDGQKAWYAKKAETQGDDMKREFPSTDEEAFEAAIEGAYYAKQMALARKEGRITRVPFTPGVKVRTFWDIGLDDSTTIWLHQQVGREQRFVGYYENSGEAVGHYASWLDRWARDRDATFERHYMPHDADIREKGSGKSYRTQALEAGLKPITVVPRTVSVLSDIEACRVALASCYFDEQACAAGIAHLDHYRKEWDDRLGVWRDTPRHDGASHGADGFRTFAMGYRSVLQPEKPDRYRRDKAPSRRSWQAA